MSKQKMSKQDRLARLIHKAEKNIDQVRYKVKNRLVDQNKVVIQPYVGFGTTKKLFIRGRVLLNRGTIVLDKESSVWRNLRASVRALNSHEIPFAKIYLPEFDKHIEANDEGFFEAWLEPSQALNNLAIQDNHYYITALFKNDDKEVVSKVSLAVAVPSDKAKFGIISDIDDTVLQSDATRTLTMIRKVLFENAETRSPFKGVAELYQALTGKHNPIFYVSSSPWNLYEMLQRFLKVNNIPQGPLLLRDWGITAEEFLPSSHKGYKENALTSILDAYPDLSFILIGDSGQEDPEIYSNLLDTYSKQILAIYIRDVSTEARDKAVENLKACVAKYDISLKLCKDSAEVGADAFDKGWITNQELQTIEDSVAQEWV